jgi:hypothetical protein
MTYVATVDLFVGVFAHLLLKQLVRRVLSYHGRHDECVGVGVDGDDDNRCKDPSQGQSMA